MASIRSGAKSALIVVDVQVGVMQNAWEAAPVIEQISHAVAAARHQQIPVIWVQHADDELVTDSAAWQIVPELRPADTEIRIHKRFNSSFAQTPLETHLDALGITHIVLAGAATNWCIRATAYAALERGYDLTLLADAHTTETMELEDGSSIPAAQIIRELNIAMTWVSYPNQVNEAVETRTIAFKGGTPHV
jgi:nicotinamidase-related amidase